MNTILLVCVLVIALGVLESALCARSWARQRVQGYSISLLILDLICLGLAALCACMMLSLAAHVIQSPCFFPVTAWDRARCQLKTVWAAGLPF